MTKDPARPAFILLLLFCVGLLGEVDYQMIPPLLPLLASTFGVTASHAARVVPVYSVASAVFSLLFGYLSDHYGRKRFIQAGLVCFSVTGGAAFGSASFETFLLARFLSGVTTGAIVTAATSLGCVEDGELDAGRPDEGECSSWRCNSGYSWASENNRA